MRSPKRSALLKQQDCRCAMCGVGFDPDDEISFIDAHHDTPRHRGGSNRGRFPGGAVALSALA